MAEGSDHQLKQRASQTALIPNLITRNSLIILLNKHETLLRISCSSQKIDRRTAHLVLLKQNDAQVERCYFVSKQN